MNVKTKLSRALWLLLIVCGIFMICSMQVDALGGGGAEQSDEYTIRDWRKHKDANYAEEDFWNIDVLCSSSTKSSYNVDNTMDNQTAADMKCIAEDETIHKYYVWKMIDGAQPFTLNTNDEHSSFSEMTHLFSLAGTNSGKGWKEYNNKDNNNNNIIDVNDSTSTSFKNANIQYIIVYLHRMSRGFDLYENFRTEDVYDSTISGTNYDNVKSNSKAYYLTNNNGAFRITNTLLYYNTVPHVLGTEGSKDMIVAIMDEGTGRPVPVKLTQNATGFSNVRTTLGLNYEDKDIVTKLQQSGGAQGVERYFPYGGNTLEGDYTTIQEAKGASHYAYNAFKYYYSEGGVTKYQIIDDRGGLLSAINAAGGPQYIASVEIALSEAITARNSAYSFMSAYGTNGGNYNTGGAITNGNNLSPENTRGVFKLSPRGVYYYLNGSTSTDIRTSHTANVIQIRMRTEVSDASYKEMSKLGNGNSSYGLNRNFKHTFATYTRGACFTREKDEGKCYERVMFNYFNDIKLTTIDAYGKTYTAYELVPNTATCSESSTMCSVKNNVGISTFYYSKNNTSTGKQQYSNLENAWGVWRQVGWSVNGAEMGGGFAPDTREFPKAPDDVQTDFSDSSNMCRWSWSERYYYNNESDYNKGYIEHYITKSGGVINNKLVTAEDNGVYKHYEELTDTYLTIIRTFPDMIFRTFEFSKYIEAGTNNPICNSAYPGINSALNSASGAKQKEEIRKEEAQISEIAAFKSGKADYDKIAEKLCENLGLTCNSVSSFEAASKAAGGKMMDKKVFANSYLAIIDALQTKDENNFTYAEHMAYAFYNFYTVIGLPDEYTVGTMFACRLEGRYYSFEDILLGDKSNIIMLNEETRLGTSATGNVDKDGNAVGTILSGLGTSIENGETVTGQITIGEKFGPELYLINETTGEVYVPEMDEAEMTCPTGYTKEGDTCKAVHTVSYNRSCDEGYAFDFTQFKCVETGSGTTHCPDGFQLAGDVCVSYDGTNAICDDGYWDPEKQVCLEYTNAYCKSGYTLTDVTEANKLAPAVTYTFARGNGDFNKFTGSGIKNFRQDSDSTISYDLNSTNGYIEVTGLNLDPSKVKLIQIKMKNASIGDTGKIYYTTANSTNYNEAKSVSFDIEPDSDANYYIYTVDMTGGMWNSTVKSLRFKLSSVNKGTIVIDNISFGSEDPDYRPEYKCIKDLDPVCPTNFTYYKGRCYGYASDLTTIPDVYELDCSHVVPKSGEKVTLASFRVGDYVNFEHGTAASVFTVPVAGTYYVELWGASNGTGKGGYTAGMVDLEEGDILYVYTATENSARSTTVYEGGLTYGNILATATSEVAGTNNLKAVTSINKITKTGSDYFKSINNIGNTTWVGEKGHSGNGFARITLYSAGGLKAASGSKTGTVKEPVNKTFGYTGTVQSTTLEPGTYTLEVWGAQGGSYSTYQLGGKGGYAKGTYKPTTNTTVYVSVGEQPTSYNGGWNGGGYGGRGGGGATHIATAKTTGGTQAPGTIRSGSYSASTPYAWRQDNTGCSYSGDYAYSNSSTSFSYHCSGWVRVPQYDYNVEGILAGLSSNKSAILIVAGGGGGAQQYDTGTYSVNAVPGVGGGTSGGGGVKYTNSSSTYYAYSGYGGTQSAGGAGGTNYSSTSYNGSAGAFGQGGAGYSTVSGGGGGGYYGGGGGSYQTGSTNFATGGGGGSGYVNTSKLSTTSMKNGERTGHGYAKITGTTNVSATLGYYILQDENSKELGACLVHSTSIDMSDRGGLELYVNNGYINKCGVEATCEYIAQEGSQVASSVHNFTYTGSVQTITLDPGRYQLEAWGAQGGGGATHSSSYVSVGGKGGYSTGIIELNQSTTLYIYVGGQGGSASTGEAFGGWNGGGASTQIPMGGGGGGSDIRIGSNSLYSRVIVAGGGGGGGNADNNSSERSDGGYGGGTTGGTPTNQFDSRVPGQGGTQTSAGASNGYSVTTAAGFGVGAGGSGVNLRGGGGGGWYGGSMGNNSTGGGGGSGYVYTSATASSYPFGCTLNSSYYLSSAQTIAGNSSFISPTGSSETGHSGNGYVRITGLEEKVDKYYKVCTDGTITEVDKSEVDNSQITNNKQSFSVKNQQNFSYTGYPQAVTLEPGTYTFEVWGAQGGSGYTNADYKGVGGKGGYTKATVKVTSTTTYYIYVGGKGTDGTAGGTHAGGFNGGGIGDDYAGGGGGATHIATAPGELSTLSGNTASVIVVAGGGGGGMNYQANTTYLKNGGAGGGTTGGDGASTNSYIATGGTQSAGGTNGQASNTTYNGSFGKGGRYHSTSYDSGGGGAGWYGGGSGYQNSSGAGGSGYVKSGLSGSTTANKREGNGYARITKTANVEKAATQVWGYSYTGKVQTVTLEPGTYKLEAWGAQGGDGMNGTVFAAGGKGGYSSGIITLVEQTTLNLYVGGSGRDGSTSVEAAGGWNGGGIGYYYAGGGGGATDIRIGGTSLSNRILVAGGGGGGMGYNTTYSYVGGVGGGYNGGTGAGRYDTSYTRYAATQTRGGYNSYSGTNGTNNGTLGTGGRYSNNYTAGGGGGYYGGAGGNYNYSSGDGGSGYIDVMLHEGISRSGYESFAAPTGETEFGHWGHGYILISDISDTYNGNGFAGNRDIISYDTAHGAINGSDFAQTSTTSMGYYPTDVLVGEKYLYLPNYYLNTVYVRNKNEDGTMGSAVTNVNWYSADTTYINYIHPSNSSNPSAYTVYYKDGVTKLVGWSQNNSFIYEWTINQSTHLPTGRVSYSAPRTFGSYGRAIWDGDETIYFVDGEGNGSSEDVYSFNIVTKNINHVTTLNGYEEDYYNYSAASGYVDVVNNEIYLSDAPNRDNGFAFMVYDLGTGAYRRMISDSEVYANVKINGSSYSNVSYMINPTNPSVGWAFSTSNSYLTEFSVNNNKVVKVLPTYVEENSTTYTYTGAVKTITLEPGTYKLEAWGAQGGNATYSSTYTGIGGKGGYASGFITILEKTTLNLYIGGQGASDIDTCSYPAGGWNGGGQGYCYSGGGGGATDIRIGGTSLSNRILVAGGGGGGHAYSSYSANGGAGGGYNGGNGTYTANWGTNYPGIGGSQTSGGIGQYNNDTYNGSFGQGGRYYTSYSAGGGGGYYGGSGGNYHGTSGGGGSGYIGGVDNGYTFDGTMTFAGVDGAYENGHSGNGAIKISKIKSVAANSGVCSMEARLKIIPTCTNGVEFDVNTNKCTLREELICKSGSSYNTDMAKCEANVAPSGCTNNGILYRVGNKYYCKREDYPFCDNGYQLINGSCIKENLDSYQNELCTAPYTFVTETKNGKVTGKCQYVEIRDIHEFNKLSLEGEMNNVEVGKIYKLTNYVGYNTTSARGARYVDGGLRFASTALFPTINVEFTLVAPKTNKLVTTELCRVCRIGGENYDADQCALLNYDTDCGAYKGDEYETYKVSIPVNVSNAVINGGLESVIAGNRPGNHMVSTTPNTGNTLVDGAGNRIVAAEYLWSMWQGIDTGFIIDSDFSTLWSEIDVYFQFKEDEFCYYNAPNNEEIEFSRATCVPYSFKEGQEKFIKVEDGVNKLNMEEDENGETYIKNIFISSVIGTPHDYVDPDFSTKSDNYVALADVYMDNTKFTDDRSDLISGFKLAPDGDVYIDRFEVLDATTLQVVFAADARTMDRCSNGNELKTGSTAKFTTSTTYNSTTKLYDLPYDNGAVRTDGEKVECNFYDPNSQIHALEGDRNYVVKVYTKYKHIKESNIAADTNAALNYISVDIQHLGNSSSKNILAEIVPSMENAGLADKIIVRGGGRNPDGTCVAIKHNSTVEISVSNMLKTKPVDNKCELTSSVTMDAAQRCKTKANNYMCAVPEPNVAMIIPADGLKNKGTTDGIYSATISGEATIINAYATWDNFTFSYSLGEGPDIETTLLMKCIHKTSQEVVEFVTRTNACVLIDTSEYEDCDLYARIENIGNTEVGISTNIRVNTSEDVKAPLDVNQGELYNADGTNKYFLTNAATYGGHESFASTSGGSETGHAGHGYARITNVDTGAVVRSFSYTGSVQSITLNKGNYKLEVWGAQGGSKWGTGGKGGYSVGTMAISQTVTANVYVGGHPADNSLTGGWNGGGAGGESPNVQVYRSPGGGGTDIRIGGTALTDRIIVAGGGGGGAKYAVDQRGGPGGGSTAHFNYYSTWGTKVEYQSQNYGGSQTESCRASVDSYGYQITCSPGGLGYAAGAGGGGYYGGGYYSCANRVYSGSGGSGYVRVSTTENQLTGDSTMAEVLVKADVTQGIKANAIHNSEDNDKYADINWTNNFDENCWLFDYTNYSIENLEVNPTKVWVPTDENGNVKNGGLVNVEMSGSYEIVKEFDSGDNKNIQIEYVLTRADKSKITSTCNLNPISKMMTGANGSKELVEFTGNCSITFTQGDLSNFMGFTVKINGGNTADESKHIFKESSYEDNEDMVSVSIAAKCEGENCMPVCDDTCTTRNMWGVNFDFLYTFDRNVQHYKTNKTANMSWTDYDVGTVSGSTQDKEYSAPIGAGNISRAPKDYMAFKSDKIDTVELCTDYKTNNSECWRYEMNVSHNVTYYLWSEAITNVYTTHKVLTSDVGTETNDAGECEHENATFVNGSETYGDVNHGASGENHDYANSSETDRNVNVCHGFTEAPNTTACAVATDWWGNKICDEWTTTFSPDKQSGSKPSDYIPYKNFQDYTLSDGAGKSPTTQTDKIILESQTQTNLDQGAGHSGWVETKTMDVCTEKAYMNISYSCDTYYTYGTADGKYKYQETTGDEGNGVCYSVGYGTDERTCAWEDTEMSPPEEVWWNDSGATCYRQHRDYTCDAYYSFTKTNTVHHNSGNDTSGTCNWSETQTGSYYGATTSSESASCSDSCTSSCCSWNTDKYGNKTSCKSKCSCTASCSKSSTHGCASTSCSKSGVDASCTAPTKTGTYYYRCKKYTASDGQTYSTCSGKCGGYATIGSYTFYHSETYDGSGSGKNMHYDCSSGDIDTGGYCYETYNDSVSLTRSDLRCVRWTTKEYKEIKYYSTNTPDSNTSSDEEIKGWVSRTYDNPSEIWQYTCDTTEPKVAYPNDTVFLKSYAEEITATSWIKTVSSGNEWIQLNFEGNTNKNARPRSGEWFDLKFVTVYTTTRAQRPGSGTTNRPYLMDFYNNYHNIEGNLGADNATIYPPNGYNHFGVNDTGKTAIGDGKTMTPNKFSDIINNEDYGYCSARPAEPYGCSYQAGTNQFMYPGKNNSTTTQGHGGAEWTTNQEGNGVCYYGPDNKTVWQKFEFGNDYYTALLICSGDKDTKGCTTDNALATAYLDLTSSKCLNVVDGLCTKWEMTWESPIRKDATGTQRRGFYLEAGWDNSKNLVFDLRGSKFNAVGQYEKELLGDNILASKEGQKFFEQVGEPIKPMCVCQTTKTVGDPNDYKWGSTEWEVE